MSKWMMDVPVLSTMHLRKGTVDAISEASTEYGYPVAPYWGGLFIFVPVASHVGAIEQDDLRALFAWARRYKYEWVRLDSIGVERDDLPTYPETWS